MSCFHYPHTRERKPNTGFLFFLRRNYWAYNETYERKQYGRRTYPHCRKSTCWSCYDSRRADHRPRHESLHQQEAGQDGAGEIRQPRNPQTVVQQGESYPDFPFFRKNYMAYNETTNKGDTSWILKRMAWVLSSLCL